MEDNSLIKRKSNIKGHIMIRKITQKSYLISMISIFSLHAGEGAIKEQQQMIEKITSKLQEVTDMEERINNLNTALSEIEEKQKQQKLEKLEEMAKTMEAKSKENTKNNKAVREI